MSKQPVDTSNIQIPDLTGVELKPGYGQPYQPTQHQDFQEQAEQARALKTESNDWSYVYAGAALIIALITLYLAIKGAKKFYNRAKGPGRATVIFSLFLGIRGARKVSDAAKSLWDDAKAIDKKVTEVERSSPQ